MRRYCQEQKIYNERRVELGRAIKISAGEDRIWNMQEKREFLDYIGINSIIQEGQEVYFRQSKGEKIGVVLGFNLENDGGFLTGSSAKSGTVVGTIDRPKLQDYLSRNK